MRIAVVSGGTKGIGRAIAELFLRHDFKVFISARNEATDFVHDNLVQCIADLSTKEGILNFASAIKKQVNKIDILVNNVGVFIPGSLIDEDEGCFETQINTNLASTYHLTRATIDHVRASNKPYIFNICSTASITPYMNGGSYCISKYAQLGLTKVLREELKQDKIKVSAVLPGATLTNSWAGTDLPKERFSDPSSVAQLIFAAYQLPDSTVMEEILVRPLEGDIT
ncbi:MAG: SDR family NAD(P)-dependent oxidoreductase [Bacteroidia bacterium]|jgi:short-subunit dehydrogenase|nr:SDR family NAD(P)-dependent oxidoreductase [Bacteroidia bacterium]